MAENTYLGQMAYINKYLQSHIEGLKLRISKTVRAPINNYNYEQAIAFSVILLATTPSPLCNSM